jgi:uncharacterized protein YijF (DUF1287 family)
MFPADWTRILRLSFPFFGGDSRAEPVRRRVLGTIASLLLASGGARADADWAERLVAAARGQVGVTVGYDGSYARLKYPGGDVPIERGVCTDVLVRAYRALGTDLQVLVHEDLSANWSRYPHPWGPAPDRNIDHRRVPNLETWFRRRAEVLPISTDAADYAAGDIVSWRLANGLPHIGIVSRADREAPLVVHNIGAGAREEAVLFAYRIVGHFRYAPPER